MQSEHGEQDRDAADDGERQEDGPPAVHIRLQAAKRWANSRRNGHRHADDAHRHATPVERENREYGDLQNRPHDARADCLKETAEQRERERGAEPCEHRADREHDHRGDDDLAR